MSALTSCVRTRRFAPAVLLLAVASVTPAALAADKSWTVPVAGNFSVAGNWSPAGVPGPGDVARLGDLPAVAGALVSLNADISVGELRLSSGVDLYTFANRTVVSGLTLVGDGSLLRIDDSIVAPGRDFETADLTINSGGLVLLRNEAHLVATNRLTLQAGAELRHQDGSNTTVSLTGPGGSNNVLVNNGLLSRGAGTTIIQNAPPATGGLFDLDGTTGNGSVRVGGGANLPDTAVLAFVGRGLSDAFGGTITLDGNARLAMTISDPWTLGTGSELVARSLQSSLPSRLVGSSELTVGGTLRVSNDVTLVPAHLEFGTAVRFAPTAAVTLAPSSRLDLEGTTVFEGGQFAVASNASLFVTGPATVEGGTFDLAPNAVLSFLGPTTVRGSTFSTASASPATSFLRFIGPTTYDGDVTYHGLVRHDGEVTVSGNTVITADVIDMDGSGGTSNWNVNASAVIHADSVEGINNSFDATLNVAGGAFARLTVNLNDPSDDWSLDGRTNLTGIALAAFPVERLAGSPVRVTGELHVQHRVRVSADLNLAAGSTIEFGDATSSLVTTGRTVVSSFAVFGTQGVLENAATGTLVLRDGVDTNGVRVNNRGLLAVGELIAGIASVDRFTSFPTATWTVDIGGYAAGAEHDLLLSTGGVATLAGDLSVRLFDLSILDFSTGVFRPEVGDEFVILTSLGGITGTFASDPVSFVGSTEYHWTVLYQLNQVALRLDAVVPEPSTGGLLLAAAGWLLRRRRRAGLGDVG